MCNVRKRLKAGSLIFTLFFIIILITNSGCDEEDNPTIGNPGTNEVFLQSGSFSPSSKTVAVGTTVKWINKANATHNIISGTPGAPSGIFNSGDKGLNGEFTHTFTTAGSFPYFCSHHSGMTGTIIVQ